MPTGYRWSRSVRREFFDRVCRGATLRQAARESGVFYNTGWQWWRNAGGMRLLTGRGVGGLANPGDLSRPGGHGHRLCFDERIEIMRGLDTGLSQAEIARRIGRHRSVVCREIKRNNRPDGDYHARMAHAYAAERACRPKEFKLDD